MKIRILKDIKIILSYGKSKFKAGDKLDLLEEDAKRLIQKGFAELLKPEKKAKVIEPETK